jgi:ankyrin repeat protein
MTRSLALATLLLGGSLASAQMRSEPQRVDTRQDLSLPEGATRFEPIHVAAMKSDLPKIADELAKGVSVDIRVEQGFFAGATPLMMAARDGDAATMRFLLESGADVNARDSARRSVLMWASSSTGSVEKIRLAVERGATLDPRSQDGATALHWAAGLGRDPDMVKALIDAGASIEIADDRGRTPLMTAARVGNAGAVQHLLNAGADRARKSPQGLNALHWAAEGRTGNAETLRVLVDAGMAIESRAADGSTPLIIAALNGRAEQLAALIALGADVNATNSWGLTPLMAAASEGTPDVLSPLLNASADPNAQDQAGRVALHYAVAKGNGIATAMISRRNPNPDVIDNDGWAPIHLARTMATLDPLVRAGADLSIRCGVRQYDDWTPLMFAAATGNTFLARRLINAGADPSVQSPNDTNALRVALAVQYPDGGNPMADLIREALAERQAAQEAEELRKRREERATGVQN